MNVIDQILNEWSFRCHDGIVDLEDPIKVSILDEVLNEYGLESFNEMKTSPTNKAIDAILNSPEAKDKLSYHSRPKRVKNIGNISNDSFIDIISNTLDVKPEEIKIIPPKGEGNPSNKNFAFKFPYQEKEALIVLGLDKAAGTDIEEYEINNINKIIEQEGGSINIQVGEPIYNNITKVEKIVGNKQADFIFTGDQNLFVQHKDLKGSQQYSGIYDISNNPEVKAFVEDVRKNTKDDILQPRQNYKRRIQSDELKTLASYGRGNEFGVDRVQVICFGNISLEKNEDTGNFEIKSPKIFIYPSSPSEDYEPYMYVTYRTGMNQQSIKNARFGFYPEKYYRAAKEI
jgi:hypothetical protein